MRFTADTATYDVIEGAHVAGLAIGQGEEGYLLFQRSGEDDPDDFGIHIELNDQANSGYGLVKECRVGRGMVELDLEEPLLGTTSIQVVLTVDDPTFTRFAEGMGKIFRGCHNQLKISA
jgi:hypothetical protein